MGNNIAGVAEECMRHAGWSKLLLAEYLSKRFSGQFIDNLAQQQVICLVVAVLLARREVHRQGF